MSSAADLEDDWEQATDLDKLKLEVRPAETKPTNQPGFIMPARLMTRSISGEINFFQDAASALQQPPPSTNVNTADEPIDSAIINAIENPRERMNVLNLENMFLNFVNSNERVMEIPVIHNSFKRLITYRVAQRFGLTHAHSEQVNEQGGEYKSNLYFTLIRLLALILYMMIIECNCNNPNVTLTLLQL